MTELVFVYNADHDAFSQLTDFAHKIFSPSTYACKLCAISYDHFSMKQEWKVFLKGLPLPTSFLYKDEFEKKRPVKADYPAVYLRTDGQMKKIISKDEIEVCLDLDQLKDLVKTKLESYDQHYHPDLQRG